MRKKTKKPEGIGGILVKVLGKIEKQGPGKRERILEAWREAAGEKALLHSRPVGIKRKALIIEVDSSTWLYDLSLKKRSTLRYIKTKLEEYKIEDIKFRMGDIS